MSAMNIEKDAQEVFNEHHKSVVLVLRKVGGKLKSNGSGFIIGGKGKHCLVLTCQHVTRKKRKYEYSVRLPGETREYNAKKLYQCSDADIALLQVCDVTGECPPLKFRDSYNLACETALFLLGYVIPHNEDEKSPPALTLFPSVSPLRISTPHRQSGPGVIEDIVCTGASRKGASGSPVLLGHDVIGILYSGGLGTQTCNVRPSETVNKVLKSWLELPDDHAHTEKLIEMLCEKLGN